MAMFWLPVFDANVILCEPLAVATADNSKLVTLAPPVPALMLATVAPAGIPVPVTE